MTKLCYVIDKFVVNVACGIVGSDALMCTSAHVILSLAKYLMNNKAEFLTKYNKEYKYQSYIKHNIYYHANSTVITVGAFNHILNNEKGETIIIRNNGYLIKKPIE